jgi:UDP-N-acetylmuramoyl-tripeptide--D-alanyl-D-alanine ligase
LRPDLAIVLCVEASHRKSFATNEEIAAEKAALVRALPGGGTAILNAGDPLVRAMARQCRGTVQFFAPSPDAEALGARFAVRGEDPGWPERFRFHAQDRQSAAPPRPMIETRFVGDQWTVAFGAAYAAARVLGLEEAAIEAGMRAVNPYCARMQPVALPNGVTFIRDEFKNDPAPFAAAVRFLRRARAARRVAIIGPASDTGLGSRDAFREMARALHGAAELYVFVGSDGDCAQRVLLESGLSRDAVHHFRRFREVHDALPSLLQPGDLVLLKGRASSHLSRLFHAQTGPIACFKNQCSITGLCDYCPELRAR